MPVVIFFACLDLEQKSSFLDGHYLTNTLIIIQKSPATIQIPEDSGVVNRLLLSKFENLWQKIAH